MKWVLEGGGATCPVDQLVCYYFIRFWLRRGGPGRGKVFVVVLADFQSIFVYTLNWNKNDGKSWQLRKSGNFYAGCSLE